MGWQKVIDKGAYASNIIHLIDTNKFTLANTRKHRNFFKIKDRLLNYNYLHEIFYEKQQDICVITRDMKPNPLHLDIVFYKKNDPKHIVVLGLRKNHNLNYFVPTTLHVEKVSNNPYLQRRNTFIKKVSWKS